MQEKWENRRRVLVDVLLQQFETSLGAELSVAVADVDGVQTVIASGFDSDLEQRSDQDLQVVGAEIGPIADAVNRWCEGDFNALIGIPVSQPGSEFHQQVWAELGQIPAGVTLTYGELADAVGHPRAARAVGSACAANENAPFVPCHRVVPASGGVGKYGYGSDMKQHLLRLESDEPNIPASTAPGRNTPASNAPAPTS